MKGERAIFNYVVAQRHVQWLERADPADTADYEYRMQQAKREAMICYRQLTGGQLAEAKRRLQAQNVFT